MRRLKAVLVLVALLTFLLAPAAQALPWGPAAWIGGGSVLARVLHALDRWSRPEAGASLEQGRLQEKIGPQMDPHG